MIEAGFSFGHGLLHPSPGLSLFVRNLRTSPRGKFFFVILCTPEPFIEGDLGTPALSKGTVFVT
jgi:hypothetical protein